MLGTKSFYTNESTHIKKSHEPYFDAGYSLDIPWNDVYTAGWMDAKPGHDTGVVWGSENQLITSRKPEYFAPDDIVRSNIIPQINISDPIYHFERSKHTYKVF